MNFIRIVHGLVQRVDNIMKTSVLQWIFFENVYGHKDKYAILIIIISKIRCYTNDMTTITNSNQSHQRMGVHGPLNILEVGSGAMEE